MYFDFEDHRPDISPVDHAISAREGVLLSIVIHLALGFLLLLMPEFPASNASARAERQRQLQLQREREARRFVFVQPRVDLEALRPPIRSDDSDKDRQAQARERALNPVNPLPFARGNSPSRVEAPPLPTMARGEGTATEPAIGTQQDRRGANENSSTARSPQTSPASPLALPNPSAGAGGRTPVQGGSLGEALRNLQRYVQQESFDNQQGGGGAFGPSIQFDTKGVEFGPWIRRFVSQIKRNWFIPYAAMSMKGHVVLTFYVQKDGTISALAVAGPSAVDAFNNAAFNALASSNPTQPLPPEYPADRAFFTVTFYYNETPPTP